MTQTATVRRLVQKGRAELCISRQTMCGHDCASCGGCAAGEAREMLVVANDPVGVRPGDTVVVESSSKTLLGIAAVVYLVPFVLFFLCYFLAAGLGEGIAVVAGLAGFAAGVLVAMAVNRREKRRGDVVFTITSVKE